MVSPSIGCSAAPLMPGARPGCKVQNGGMRLTEREGTPAMIPPPEEVSPDVLENDPARPAGLVHPLLLRHRRPACPGRGAGREPARREADRVPRRCPRCGTE